uniref:GATOR complex protein NPRL3 n=1 Tax=Strigamia maritima TaxID=126957 RepID=T1JKU7_STRMM
MKETDPVNVILVKHGSKGDRLLFRYPFSEITRESKKQTTSVARIKPYALVSSFAEDNARQPPLSNISNGQLVGFSDKVLSNLFAVTTQLSRQKFELKVNDVRFVGHPTLLQSAQVSPKRLTSTLILFHIVFALPANASYSVVRCYHDLSYRLGVCLRHEERRCGHLSKETKIMLAAHDEVSGQTDVKESVFDMILNRSQLAKDLKYIYDELCSSGVIQMRINRWLQISFCLPQRIHSFSSPDFVLDPESLDRCINSLKPYHALLLLVSECDFVSSLPLGASPALIRIIQASSPLKSLQELAIDADLSITQVFRVVGHLIYWAKATIIYPLCETNVYILSPNAPTHIDSPLVEKFNEIFPGINLLVIMAEFSLPVSLSQRGNPTHIAYQQTQLLQIIIWMLQHNLLMQLHTYVYLIPTEECVLSRPPSRGSSSSEWSRNRLDLTIDIDDTSWSNFPACVSSLSSPVANNSQSNLRLHNENSDDIRLFDRLRRYFCGKYHLEEIMYYENIRRTPLLFLLDKFRDILITCEHEDDAVSMFYKQSKTWS